MLCTAVLVLDLQVAGRPYLPGTMKIVYLFIYFPLSSIVEVKTLGNLESEVA